MSEQFVTKAEFEQGMTGLETILGQIAEGLGTQVTQQVAEEKKLSAIQAIRLERDNAIDSLKNEHSETLAKLEEKKAAAIKTFNKKKADIIAKFKPQIDELKSKGKEEFLDGTEKAGFFVGKAVSAVTSGPITIGKKIAKGVKEGVTSK